ncbi:hypothetical protein FBZ93_11612 [Bradyrhizobium macuxiense]|uniref:Uncharacterized protein n=1 Tax=Bradyrhizobium macuxiense TaxID=1755647 RepID=A0A560L1S0_9BRAD|nr:hypothetical protein [Bradyrhizobium macuxiense]TWB89297.1 hypothetical protein FBZ93_11612 [Bradyrhizobium macuxiense]
MLTLNSSRFALIERSRDFALPLRPVLERAYDQVVTGSVGGGTILVGRHEAPNRKLKGLDCRTGSSFPQGCS